MNLTTRTLVRMIADACELPGTKTPKLVSAATERAERIIATPWRPATETEIAEAVADALAASKDPSTDATVTRLLASRTLASMIDMRAIEEAAWGQAADVIAEHADAIVVGLRPVFDAAARTMNEAAPVIGHYALAEHEVILSIGGDAAEHYVRVQAAEKVIGQIVQGWTSMATIARFTISPTDRLIKIAEPPAVFPFDHPLRRKPTAWDVVRAGLSLSLPTLEEYRARNLSINPAPIPREELERQAYRNDPVRQAEAKNLRRAINA